MKTKTIFLFTFLLAFSIQTKAQLANKKFEIKMGQMGTFYVEFGETTYKLFNPMGDVGVAGTYKTENNTIQFTDKEGQMACPETVTGTYKFTLQNDELKLELIKDECTGRPQMAAVPWKQVKNNH